MKQKNQLYLRQSNHVNRIARLVLEAAQNLFAATIQRKRPFLWYIKFTESLRKKEIKLADTFKKIVFKIVASKSTSNKSKVQFHTKVNLFEMIPHQSISFSLHRAVGKYITFPIIFCNKQFFNKIISVRHLNSWSF